MIGTLVPGANPSAGPGVSSSGQFRAKAGTPVPSAGPSGRPAVLLPSSQGTLCNVGLDTPRRQAAHTASPRTDDVAENGPPALFLSIDFDRNKEHPYGSGDMIALVAAGTRRDHVEDG